MFSKEKIKIDFCDGVSETNEYFRHFGFHKDPFERGEKENSLYLLPSWEQKIDLLVHYLCEENTLLILSGAKGIGKTTLINVFLLEALHGFSPIETAAQSGLRPGEFLIQLGDNLRTCQFIAESTLMPEQILEVVSGAFDVSTEDFFGSYKEQCDSLLDSLQYCKQNCILLIDDAQELPDTSLELLLYMISLQSDDQHRLHMVLIGDSELKKRMVKIAKAKNYDGLTYPIDLTPLTRSQTEYYLQHRFVSAGLDGEMPLSNRARNKVYKISGGIPESINQIGRQFLVELLKKKHTSSLSTFFNLYKKTFVGGIFLLASFAIILGYLGQGASRKISELKRSNYRSVVVRKEPESVSPTGFSMASSSPVLVVSPPNSPMQLPQTQAHLEAIPPISSQIKVQPQIQNSQQFVSKQSTSIETSSLTDPVPAIFSENDELIVPLKSPKKSEATFLLKAEGKKAVDAKPNFEKNSAVQIDEETPKAEQSLHYSKRLMQANAAHYTLRLTEMSREASVKAFIAKYKLGGNGMYYLNKNTGEYIVVYGEYADLETAKRAMHLLPKSLRSFRAQPVEVSVIQQIIH